MSYNWQNGEVITAEKLNNTGSSDSSDDIFVIHITSIDSANYTATIEETYADLFAAYTSGKIFKTITPMLNVQYGTQRYYGNVIDTRGIGYPQNFIEFRWYNGNDIVTMMVYEDGSIYYAQSQ